MSRSHPGFLPSPATSYSRAGVGTASPGGGSGGGVQGFLLQRARTTNLAVILLTGVCMLSLAGNLTDWWTSSSRGAYRSRSIRATLPSAHSTLNHLIIVPCHSVWLGIDPRAADRDDQWMLEPYQQGGSVEAWLGHIRRGIDEVVSDPNSLLVFTGGQTRPHTPFPGLSESASYARLAASLSPSNTAPGGGVAYDAYWQAGQRLLKTEDARRASGVGEADKGQVFARATTEEFALDSLSNVMFSIARFKEFTNRYPQKITIVGYAFKAHRFLHSHLPSLRWPATKVSYVGIDGQALAEGVRREERYGRERVVLEDFSRDRYACRTGGDGSSRGWFGNTGGGKKKGRVWFGREKEVPDEAAEVESEGKGNADGAEAGAVDKAFAGLGGKRRRRNPGRRWHGYLNSAPEMRALMEWCPLDGTSLFSGSLPWA